MPWRNLHPGRAFRAIVPTVHAEDGCLECEPVVDAEGVGELQAPAGPDTFLVVEKRASVEALNAHSAAPHMTHHAAKVGHPIAGRAVHVLTAAPG